MSALLKHDETLTLGLNVIVRPGDYPKMCPLADPTECSGDFCDCSLHPPQDWVALTGPCPTCKGTHEVELDRWTGKMIACPDCRDGRRPTVPLYRECPHIVCIDNPYAECPVCDQSGTVLVGRGSIVEVVPVVDYEDWQITCEPTPSIAIDHYGGVIHMIEREGEGARGIAILLDPLPVPGRDFGIVIDVVELA